MHSDERRGLLIAVTGFALLSVTDALVKSMVDQWPPVAVAAVRFTMGAILLAGLLAAREGRAGFAFPAPGMQILRGAGLAVASASFFAAVRIMPLATATAIVFTSPMITAVLAAIFLKESVRVATWVAIAVAFSGVLVVLRPNFELLGWEALLPLGGAAGMSMLMIGNRAIASRSGAVLAQMLSAGIAAGFLIVISLIVQVMGKGPFNPGAPDWTVVARCLLVAVLASGAHGLVYLGTMRAGASSVAPMTYVQILGAVTFGWLFFGDHPDLLTVLGIAVIVGAGVCLWLRGRRLQIEPAP